jgi:DNA-binding response OmpR family regulator
MARIFLVEDNDSLREAINSYLKLNDHEVFEFPRGSGVIEALDTKAPDLIILDVMLPDANGFQLAKKIRKDHDVPIVFLTAKTAESDRITGFEVGGDDYVVKPFSPKELVLRVEAILKRSRKDAPETVPVRQWVYGNHTLEMDSSAHRALVDEKEVSLTPAEWKILEYFANHPSIVVERNRLLGESLDYFMAEGSERTIDTHVKNLRAKLADPGWIETVRGFGYRFSGEVK